MWQTIQKILQTTPGLDGFKIIARQTEGYELFFIRKTLDMNRAKTVTHYLVTVYKDFKAEGTRYKGAATAKIHPTMDEAEIREAIEASVFAAGFVKNKYFPMPQPAAAAANFPPSAFDQKPLADWLPQLIQAIYRPDTLDRGGINSAELFLNRTDTRLITSTGIDQSVGAYHGQLEFIADWRENDADVELYQDLHFADVNPDQLTAAVAELLRLCREKALAQPTPALKKHTVLLTGEAARSLLRFYYDQSAAKSVYEELSTWQPGQQVQGKTLQGDPIQLTLDPWLKGSTASSPFDDDGLPLTRTEVIKDGRLLRYWGDWQYAYYLNVPPTGVIPNLVFAGGSKPRTTMKQETHLELAVFSDFQMDTVTGDFGGEIRLGWYFDGTRTIPVSGGSISGNIREVQQRMYLSQELQTVNNFVGPQTIQLFNVAVTGQA